MDSVAPRCGMGLGQLAEDWAKVPEIGEGELGAQAAVVEVAAGKTAQLGGVLILELLLAHRDHAR